MLDPTPNAKLDELSAAFLRVGGEAHVGGDAWAHLEALAGPTMARFLEKYVHDPLAELLHEEPVELPDLLLSMDPRRLTVGVGDERFSIARARQVGVGEKPQLPDDVDDQL